MIEGHDSESDQTVKEIQGDESKNLVLWFKYTDKKTHLTLPQ